MDLTILILAHRDDFNLGRTLASIDRRWMGAPRADGLHAVIVILEMPHS